MGGIYPARDIEEFHMMLTVWCWEPELANSWFGYHAH
jgi:hypothetical protein